MESDMNKILFFVLTILFVSSTLLGFSDIFITYKSGECKVDIEGNGEWIEAAIDMELYSSSVIKTGPDGELEIEVDEETVSIGRNSIMELNDLLERVGEKKKTGWLKNISKYAKSIGKGDETYASTALAGVRGDDTGGEELEWFEDIEEGVIKEYQTGKKHFEEGNYTKAIQVFTDIIDTEETVSFRDEVAFYLGVSLFNNLRYAEALPYLNESIANKRTYFYELALIHYSITNYFLKNYTRAIEGFNTYTEGFAEGYLKPYAVFMLGKCYKAVGKKEEARGYFTEVKEKYKDTDVYYDALTELRAL